MNRDLRKVLNIDISSPYWEEAYEHAIQESGQPEWLTEAYIRELHAEYEIFPENLEMLVLAAQKVSQIEELCIFAKVLRYIIGLRTGAKDAFPSFELPIAPNHVEDTMAYDCVAIFPILAHIRPSWKELEARGIEADVLRLRFSMVDRWLSGTTQKVGRPFWGKNDFLVYGAFVYVTELTLERLRFQWVEHSPYPVKAFANCDGELRLMMDGVTLHASGHVLGTYGFTEETGSFYAEVCENEEEYVGYLVDSKTHLTQNYRTKLSKKEWRLVFAPGDAIIKVHIAPGAGFDAEACEKSFAKARALFARSFPEYDFKGFLTHTWLLGPALEPALREGSNIKNFRKYFHVFPAQSDAKDVFLYVYKMSVKSPDDVVIDDLPEDNSLRKGVKEQLQNGNFVYEFNGFIAW